MESKKGKCSWSVDIREEILRRNPTEAVTLRKCYAINFYVEVLHRTSYQRNRGFSRAADSHVDDDQCVKSVDSLSEHVFLGSLGTRERIGVSATRTLETAMEYLNINEGGVRRNVKAKILAKLWICGVIFALLQSN